MKKFLPVIAIATIALAGCSAPAADDGLVHIVASTSVYGDLAQQVAGDNASVVSLIDRPNDDPHSFEASARDQLALADADLIIENGGGYDPFMQSLLDAAGSSAPVIDAFEVSGLPGPNEHVWYSFAAVELVVDAIVERLSAVDPGNAGDYVSNGTALTERIDELQARAEAIAQPGDALVTEPVPVYLLESVGLADVTPSDFTEAIEEGNDVPPLAMQATLALLDPDRVALLAYNSQTASPETERVRSAAEATGIPVVDFTETLPEGKDYVSWMSDNLDALETALGR